MKKTRFQMMQQQMIKKFGPEQGGRIAEKMEKEMETFHQMYKDQPKALEPHTEKNIFPLAAAYRALQAEGVENAREAAQSAFLELMEVPAQAIRKALKVPGLYRLMPKIWKVMMPRMFGEDAGFRFRIRPTDAKRVTIDMMDCPYLRTCRELGCPELAPTFCTTDDICYGHMHKKLIWNRTKTLARGGDICDFDLYIP